jgi:microsomal epoxide hydrolase
MGLFSEKKDAQAIIMTHGWPGESLLQHLLAQANYQGSFLEFLPFTEYLSKKYTPETLPVNLIVPSLIGYGYSSAPPVDKEFRTRDNAPIFNSLMEGLGFTGYIAQGGDVGSAVSRYLAEFDSCKGTVFAFPTRYQLTNSNSPKYVVRST